jgi:hypothetical protein
MLAVVSLADQHITLYGAHGKIAQAPVSSGAKDYETPAGIFSIVQKKEDHRSNIYEDGEMPFMQRITWTGIALHAGALPGYPASHGCVRLPMSFARDLFDATELGMRVIIVREDMLPSEISHPALFKSKPVPKELGLGIVLPPRRAQFGGAGSPESEIVPGSARHVHILETIAAAKAAELQAAAKRQKETRTAATRAAAEAVAALRHLRAGESTLARAEGALKAVEKQIETATSPEAKTRAEAAKEKAAARADEAKAKLEAAKAQEQTKRDAAERANAEARAAVAAKELAAQAAEDAGRSTMPVSVLVSRKMRRLYVRRGTYPVFEAPVEIRDADRPIGTFVFTALDHRGTQGDLRWTVVAMYKDPLNIPPAPTDQPRRDGRSKKTATPSDVAAAKAALDRIGIHKESLDIIVGHAVRPGASLIISDEGPSREIGKDTDFILIMSGEPQGALKIRQRELRPKDYYDDSPWGSPWGSYKSPRGGYKSAPSSKGPFFWMW